MLSMTKIMSFIFKILQEKVILPWEEKTEGKKLLEEAKNIFNSLTIDPNTILFSEEIINDCSRYNNNLFFWLIIVIFRMKIKYQQELVLLKKEKYTGQLYIVLTDLSSYCMLMLAT